jgi:hypothetical protein
MLSWAYRRASLISCARSGIADNPISIMNMYFFMTLWFEIAVDSIFGIYLLDYLPPLLPPLPPLYEPPLDELPPLEWL